MAVRRYNYKPNASRNDAIKKIQQDLAALEIELSDDTIRQKLQLAAELHLKQS
jgi:hypothetical protein